MEEINIIYKVAPISFGMIIGWIVFYFIRLYKDYNVHNLIETASVFVGGVGLCSLSFFAGTYIGSISFMYYLLGCALGCFFHFIYQFIISLCFQNKFCRTWDKYTLLSSCNIPIKKQDYIRSIGIKAERLEECFKLLIEGKITDNEFVEFIKNSSITKSEYNEICQVEIYFILSDKALVYIKAKGLEKHFKD